MKLTVFDVMVAEGTEIECAMFACVFLEALRMKDEHDKKKEVDEWLEKYGDMTFDELMRKEREDGE